MHPLNRPHQKETYDRIRNSPKKYIVISAPTGFGKSAMAGQMAYDGHKTLALVGVKSLQQQYQEGYGLVSLFGKGNYLCGNQQAALFGEQITADDCEPDDRNWCSENCEYPLRRQEFLAANGGVLNYHKFLMDKPLVDEFSPEYLFCDEAHLLSDTVVDFAGLVFNWNSKQLKKYTGGFQTSAPQPIAFKQVRQWLESFTQELRRNKPLHPSRGGKLYEWQWHKNKLRQIETTLALMNYAPESWFIDSTAEGLTIKPLTARFNFDSMFNRAEKVVLMSATIDRHTLRELGVNDFEFITIPNSWPAPLRRVIDLRAPKIGYSSSLSDWQEHGKVIADKLNELPAEWTGLIHTPSKHLAYSLRDRLAPQTNRSYFIPEDGLGTEEVYSEWMGVSRPGTIALVWQAWEGWDCGKDRINIVAKVPFTDFSDEFERQRFFYDGKAGYSRTAAKMVQGLGRIRRGNREDYGHNKFVGIADGNWGKLKKYIGPDILDSIL